MAESQESPYTFTKPEGLLAHYTKAAVVFEHVLPCRQMRMSPYHKVRDPAENQDFEPVIHWSGDPPGLDDAISGVRRHIKSVRDAMRVLAFTRDVGDGVGLIHPTFDCSWARPRMWEQYGDNHCGACLLFDQARLEQTLRDALGEERIYRRNVDYDREGIAVSPAQTMSDPRIFDDEQREIVLTEHIDRNQRDFFFLKSDDFETESEYRVVLRTDEGAPVGYTTDAEGYAYVGYGDALVAVVLGDDFPRWQRPGAREASDGANVELRQMRWERGTSPWLRPVRRAPSQGTQGDAPSQ